MKIHVKCLMLFIVIPMVVIGQWSVTSFAAIESDDTIEVCYDSPVPSTNKYVKTDSYFDKNRCNGYRLREVYEKQGLYPMGNIHVYTLYTEKEAGDEIDVCYNSAIPRGWIKTDSYFSKNDCDGYFLLDKYERFGQDSPDNIFVLRKSE